jgi:NAD(P)-dependent dehydrogenase (short-subunit alcohol dehydrogenase family)
MNLSGQTLLIVGTTGIGSATAKLAAQAGAQVFVVSRTENNCRALAEEIEASGGHAKYFVADQTDAGQVEASSVMARCMK